MQDFVHQQYHHQPKIHHRFCSFTAKKKPIGSEKRESAISSNIPYSSFKDSRLGKRGKTSVSGITLGFFAAVSQVVESVPFLKYFKRIWWIFQGKNKDLQKMHIVHSSNHMLNIFTSPGVHQKNIDASQELSTLHYHPSTVQPEYWSNAPTWSSCQQFSTDFYPISMHGSKWQGYGKITWNPSKSYCW